jgi:Fe-S-cluster containining protein
MRDASATLPVIESCAGCGACCQVVTSPPFRRVFDAEGEEAWERLRRERPDLVRQITGEAAERRLAGGLSYGSPCLWYDPEARACRHYELRPRACREFAVGGADCRDARRRAGVP